jgi:hypothetical protein
MNFRIPLLSLTFILQGCALSLQPQHNAFEDSSSTAESARLLASADSCFGRADNFEILDQCKNQYMSVLKSDPGSYPALKQLSTTHTLIGTAYTEGASAKSVQFSEALRYSELAMYNNAEFRTAVKNGAELWEAIDLLTSSETEAMFFWVTALQYEFKEGMNLAQKVANVYWLKRALRMLEQIEKVDPDFGGGAVDFAKAICYYALPRFLGGSKELGDEAMQAAMAHGDRWLLPRWAMGKYYYVITDQPKKSRAELKWVAMQDPKDYSDPYPWRIHFIENSAELVD